MGGMQPNLWWVAGAMAALAVGAGLGEHPRRRPRELDPVGLMTWELIQVLAMFAAVGAALAAMHG